jgi:hypothetical protein
MYVINSSQKNAATITNANIIVIIMTMTPSQPQCFQDNRRRMKFISFFVTTCNAWNRTNKQRNSTCPYFNLNLIFNSRVLWNGLILKILITRIITNHIKSFIQKTKHFLIRDTLEKQNIELRFYLLLYTQMWQYFLRKWPLSFIMLPSFTYWCTGIAWWRLLWPEHVAKLCKTEHCCVWLHLFWKPKSLLPKSG